LPVRNTLTKKKFPSIFAFYRSLEGKLYPLNDPTVEILVTNSNVKHELGDSEYANRRKNCIEAARLLNKTSLREVTLEELEGTWRSCDSGAIFGDMVLFITGNKHLFDDETYRRAKHAVTEIRRTELAAQALTNNDMKLFGRLMNESHLSLK
jgi:galactokinase